MKTLGISMIVKNEEANLPLSLGPLSSFADETVVMDTGSIDRTKEIAKNYGAIVFCEEFRDDFAYSRNLALKEASTDYVMWLDADNSIDVEDFLKIKEYVGSLQKDTIIVLEELVVPQGDRLYQKRVFPKRDDVYFQGRIHEQLIHPTNLPTFIMDIEVRHWGYSDAKESAKKGERNLAILLKDPLTKEGDFYHLYQCGRTLYNLKRFHEALHYLERAKDAKDPNISLWSHSFILISSIKKRFNLCNDAVNILKELNEKRPDYGAGHYFLGRLYYDLGRHSEAETHLKKAMDLGLKDHGWGLASEKLSFICASILGKLYKDQNNEKEAISYLLMASKLDPNNPEPRVQMAQLLMDNGRRDDALKHIEMALEVAPYNRRAKDLRVSYYGS
jgi:tetratricopeptide (TPR) repeat protein